MVYGATGISMENKYEAGKKKYFGKYRGIVTNNQDLQNRGRLKLQVPAVLGQYDSNWALPCLPPGSYVIPKEGAGVWVEFEEGKPEKPIWVGYWLAEGETIRDVVKVGFNFKDGKLEIYGGEEIECVITGFNKILLGEGADAPLSIGDTLKEWLDDHTHDYTWTDSGGSGTTDSPATNSPDPSDEVKIRR